VDSLLCEILILVSTAVAGLFWRRHPFLMSGTAECGRAERKLISAVRALLNVRAM
jgi:hypothetical protein